MFCLRWNDWVAHNLKHVVDHLGHQIFHILVGSTQIRIIVHFNQPNAKVLIKQEVKTKKLIDILSVIWVHFALDTKEAIDHKVFDPR